MYSIIMNRDKSLSATVKETIKQHEKLANKIQFIFPLVYEQKDLSVCKVVMKFHNELNQASLEFLIKEDAPFRGDFMRCFLPVDSALTNAAGDVTICFSFIDIDIDNNVTYVLNTGEYILNVEPVKDYFEFVDSFDSSITAVDEMIGKKLDWYESEKSLVKKDEYCDVVLIDGTDVNAP